MKVFLWGCDWSHLALLRNLERFERLETGTGGSHSMTQGARSLSREGRRGLHRLVRRFLDVTTTVRTALVPGASRADPRAQHRRRAPCGLDARARGNYRSATSCGRGSRILRDG